MKETRRVDPMGRVYTTEDLGALARVVDEARKQLSDDRAATVTSFKVHRDGDVTFETDNIVELLTDSRLRTRRVKRIDFDLYSWKKTDAALSICLVHGEEAYLSHITVAGSSSSWVADTTERIRQVIEASKPQRSWITAAQPILRPVIALSLGTVVVTIMVAWAWLVATRSSAEANGTSPLTQLVAAYPLVARWVMGMFLVGFAMFVGYLPAEAVYSRAHQLWPSVELQAGPSHLLAEENARNRLKTILVVCLLPLLITLGVEAGKILI